MTEKKPFWETVALADMNREQWESLCDGCAKCCLHKLEDEDDGQVYYTKVVCRYMDDDCRCTEYQRRNELVPNCVWLRPEDIESFHWLPSTCAYRLVHEGKPLANWHPLLSGRADSVHEAGISIKGRALSENFVHPDGYEEHIVHWVE
ncbi:YcgN family cysteine cluster protein [Dasania marina]|uniref:YcgN family cysteine cluster protein n=1 Tax=Dasania marina TaxID=471499 RepID=UPI00047582FA|nr:YcgN family cysteine cluster protein [Dasania marina]